MVPWVACCVARDEDVDRDWLTPCASVRQNRQAEESDCDLHFYDCAETQYQLLALRKGHSAGAALEEPPEDSGRSDCMCSDLIPVEVAVLERTIEEWEQRVNELHKAAGEVGKDLDFEWEFEWEWATPAAARRMLRANLGDFQKAVDMFVQALEVRQRDRKLFQTMQCTPRSDIRIIGCDLEEHPVIYMCGRSMVENLRAVRDQFVVTFEAACMRTSEEGRVVFVIDAHGLQPHLFTDIAAVKDLADTLSTVYAERIRRIIIVDFSKAAQAVWWMLKPFLSPATKEKFDFLSHRQARDRLHGMFDTTLYSRICKTFEINRDPNCTAEERALHARRTTMCDIPLGPPLS